MSPFETPWGEVREPFFLVLGAFGGYLLGLAQGKAQSRELEALALREGLLLGRLEGKVSGLEEAARRIEGKP